MFCTRCGQSNSPDADACTRCGALLVRPGRPVTGERVSAERAVEQTSTFAAFEDEDATGVADSDHAVDQLPADAALLLVRRGPNAGSRFLLDADVTTAGRHPDSDIFLDDVTVSRRHAEFRRAGEAFSVTDVGSLNGTYLNRERIDASELASGDEVQVGKFRLVFLTGDRSGPAGAQP